ncbi:hypothetical protein QN277_010258 [Acacia crassicarpa]|nr:hypothetical protein QN277_010258 [Acacia crassicarpa]
MAGQDKVGQATIGNGRFIEELEVEKLLEKMNKPAVKSIKSHDGDVIDCVHILNQPAFDHPKLKNHNIQMRPTFVPKGRNRRLAESKPIAQMWNYSGSCPKGTVPIRRITKEDILRASSFQQFGKKDNKTIPYLSGSLHSRTDNHEYATAEVWGDEYYGANAFINIWKTKVQQRNEFSLSQIWIMNQEDGTNNVESIEAGWQIHPMLYGDKKPRLFAYWTSDSYERIGCYNLQCPGFVQVSNEVVVGGTLQPLSVDGGSQYGISLLIWKDQGSGNWWMKSGDTDVGYWPASIFDSLSESASRIKWGGEVINKKSNGKHTTTEMGSGYFARAGFGKASFFKDISVVNGNNNLETPNYFNTYASNPMCYDIVLKDYSDDWGANFYYGGPGRNPFCQI